VIIDIATAPTPVAPWMELLYVALAASLIVTRKRWQSGAVLAAMLAMVGAYVAGVSF
jgi:hypothetical protein